MKLQLEQPHDTPQESSSHNSNFEQNFSNEPPIIEEPIHTTSTSIPTESKKEFHIPGFVIVIVILIIAGLLAKSFIPKLLETTDITNIAKSPKETMETELGISLSESESFVNTLGIPNSDTTGFQTFTDDGNNYGLIYYNNQQYGVTFNSKKYSIFGIKIGDSESSLIMNSEENNTLAADSGIGYSYSYYFESFKEDVQYSSDYYFVGTDGSILVLRCNNSSHRVVSIEYYYDKTRILKDVDLF